LVLLRFLSTQFFDALFQLAVFLAQIIVTFATGGYRPRAGFLMADESRAVVVTLVALVASESRQLHLSPRTPMLSIIIIVSWQWLPFAILILMTAMQSLDQEQLEAARIEGAGPIDVFRHVTLPHLARPLAVVVMIETIFLLSIFAEIFTTTGGGPGTQTTNLAYLIYSQALLQYDVGMASAGGVVAVVLANVVAFFLIRVVGKSLAGE
jgi:ABC-type sugar transport system permease subunit